MWSNAEKRTWQTTGTVASTCGTVEWFSKQAEAAVDRPVKRVQYGKGQKAEIYGANLAVDPQAGRGKTGH